MRKQNLGFLTMGLVVGLLVGGVYSQRSAVAANGQPGRGKLVSIAIDEAYMYRAWENGEVELRDGIATSVRKAGKGVNQWIPLDELLPGSRGN